MQILAQNLCNSGSNIKRALVITPRPRSEIAGALMRGLRAALGESPEHLARSYLDQVMLSVVFDVDGVWEVLAELNRAAALAPAATEIQDSQDEEDEPSLAGEERRLPDMIIITHVSSLLTSLFTQRSSQAAHTVLRRLSARLRHLSRTLSSHPVVLLLNSTSSSSSSTPSAPPTTLVTSTTSHEASNKPLDPTLRSIFNPPPIPGYRSVAPRRNKPTFGLVFAQMLDMHLLCTSVPRSAEDADEIFAPAPAQVGADRRVELVTVVEVLLDELGVWEEGRRRGPRRLREQRWAPVEIRGGKIVDMATETREKIYGELRLAAGFGGPRV